MELEQNTIRVQPAGGEVVVTRDNGVVTIKSYDVQNNVHDRIAVPQDQVNTLDFSALNNDNTTKLSIINRSDAPINIIGTENLPAHKKIIQADDSKGTYSEGLSFGTHAHGLEIAGDTELAGRVGPINERVAAYQQNREDFMEWQRNNPDHSWFPEQRTAPGVQTPNENRHEAALSAQALYRGDNQQAADHLLRIQTDPVTGVANQVAAGTIRGMSFDQTQSFLGRPFDDNRSIGDMLGSGNYNDMISGLTAFIDQLIGGGMNQNQQRFPVLNSNLSVPSTDAGSPTHVQPATRNPGGGLPEH